MLDGIVIRVRAQPRAQRIELRTLCGKSRAGGP